jgi:hypothetical protein
MKSDGGGAQRGTRLCSERSGALLTAKPSAASISRMPTALSAQSPKDLIAWG